MRLLSGVLAARTPTCESGGTQLSRVVVQPSWWHLVAAAPGNSRRTAGPHRAVSRDSGRRRRTVPGSSPPRVIVTCPSCVPFTAAVTEAGPGSRGRGQGLRLSMSRPARNPQCPLAPGGGRWWTGWEEERLAVRERTEKGVTTKTGRREAKPQNITLCEGGSAAPPPVCGPF